ncbi:hypothetical protein ACIRQP_21235 [Streptomyces sp. NPDC102274]|uniref:hypothetical protein n=1 Tax=Streptomyces sp. NPDC102274 TaxID=3366151 RepID=UPI003810735C
MRPVGAFERLYYRFTERSPLHFVVAVEFDAALAAADLRTALAAVQARHPLLNVHVEDRPSSGLGFYRAPSVPAVDVRVADGDPRAWQSAGAEELARPFDRAVAPLMRAVLLRDEGASTVLLTFDHTIADGMSATYVLKDLVASLNGVPLSPLPVPLSQEELIARALPAMAELDLPEPPAPDPRMRVPATNRPFTRIPPQVGTLTLDAAFTTTLLERCRAEKATVHAAVVVAASRARATLREEEEYVRVLSPFNIRSHIGGVGECVDYFLAAPTGMVPHDGSALWDQARRVCTELGAIRSALGVVTASTILQQVITSDADAFTAAEFMIAGLSFEVMISNLGVLDIAPAGPVRPRAVWGPMILTQLEGEEVLGIVTYEGQLRIVACGPAPTDALLEAVRTTLIEACG